MIVLTFFHFAKGLYGFGNTFIERVCEYHRLMCFPNGLQFPTIAARETCNGRGAHSGRGGVSGPRDGWMGRPPIVRKVGSRDGSSGMGASPPPPQCHYEQLAPSPVLACTFDFHLQSVFGPNRVGILLGGRGQGPLALVLPAPVQREFT